MSNEQRVAHIPPYICWFICGSEIGTYCYLLIYQVSLFLSPIDSVDGPHLRVRVMKLCSNAAKLHTTQLTNKIRIDIDCFSFGIFIIIFVLFIHPILIHMFFPSSFHCILWWGKWFLLINVIEYYTIYTTQSTNHRAAEIKNIKNGRRAYLLLIRT